MTDTPTTVTLTGPNGALSFLGVSDGNGNNALQSVPRVDNAPVSTANPMPTADVLADAALGAPTDAVWTAGAGSVIALLKALASGGGSATEGNQVTANNLLAEIEANTVGLATAAGQAGALTVLNAMAASLAGGATATNQVTGNTSLATIAEALAGAATAANQTAGNTALTTIAQNVATAAAQASALTQVTTIATAQGAAGSGITEPTGGIGLLGWLSGIYAALKATLTVTLAAGTNAIGSVSVTAGTAAIGSVTQTPSALTNSTSGNVTASATIVVPFSSTRKWLMFSNRTTGTETHDLGSSNVAVGGGIPIAAGGGFLFNGPGAAGPIYGITTVASSPFSYVEG